MKIIQVDNFQRESVDDFLVCEKITDGIVGEFIVERLNERYAGEDSSVFYRLVSDDYPLHKFNPNGDRE